MTRTLTLAAGALAAAALAAPPALAKGTPARFFLQSTGSELVDTGAAGDSVGDMTILSFRALERRGGRQVGTGHGYCVRTEVGVARTCMLNTSLSGGRLVLQWEERDDTRITRAAIVGGTRRHKTMRGDLRLTTVG